MADLGYVSSGRMMADAHFDSAMSLRRSAQWCFRVGLRYDGRQTMRQALRAWRNYKWYRARIVQ